MKKQKTHGVVYTPRRIVEFILNQAGFTGAEDGNLHQPGRALLSPRLAVFHQGVFLKDFPVPPETGAEVELFRGG